MCHFTGSILGPLGQQIAVLGTSILGALRMFFLLKANIDILCLDFSFLAYERSLQLLFETLDTSIEALITLFF